MFIHAISQRIQYRPKPQSPPADNVITSAGTSRTQAWREYAVISSFFSPPSNQDTVKNPIRSGSPILVQTVDQMLSVLSITKDPRCSDRYILEIAHPPDEFQSERFTHFSFRRKRGTLEKWSIWMQWSDSEVSGFPAVQFESRYSFGDWVTTEHLKRTGIDSETATEERRSKDSIIFSLFGRDLRFAYSKRSDQYSLRTTTDS